ncbi:hypothetical protein [Oerskovia turbata]
MFSLLQRTRWVAGVSAAALMTLSGLTLAPSAQAADTATFEIGTIYRLDSGATENAGEAQPQPHGYDTYVTFASSRLPDGTPVDASQVYTISGGDYTTVTVPADATMPTQVYPRTFGADGAPTSFITLYGLNEGLWHGGGFPAGSSWNADGRWVGPNGQPTAFVGGSGGYVGSAPWVAPVDGERVTLVDKYYAVDITKTFDDGSDPSGRIFYSANGTDPVNSSRHFAWETGADGKARGWWMSGWFSQVWEYLSPAEVAAGMTGVSLASDYGWGQGSLTAPIPSRTLTAADLAAIDANPYAPQATRDLVSRFEVGGVLIGPVAVHSTHPSTFVTVTAVNHRTPPEPRVKPTITLEVPGCVAEDGSTPVTGTTTNAPNGSTVTHTAASDSSSTTVTDDAFTSTGVLPGVEYTFTLTTPDDEASIVQTFTACTPPPPEPTIALDVQQCVASDGSSSVPGATTDAADGSTVAMSDGNTTTSSLVTHDAFTAEHVRPAVDYTFTVTDGDRTASVHATFPVCPPPPADKPTTPPTTPPVEQPAQPTTSRAVVQHKKPTAPPRAARHGALATTGAGVGVALAIAAGALAAGIALTSVRRRKDSH